MREENKSWWGLMQGNAYSFYDSIKVVAFNIFISLIGKESLNIIL
jgi:hypothetical protein